MRHLLLVCGILFLVSCSGDHDRKDLENKKPEELYAMGEESFSQKKYVEAAKLFAELEKLHPYSKLVPRAQIAEGDCYYKAKKFDQAVSSYEIFVKTFPTNEMVKDVLYKLGGLYLDQVSIVQRDQEATVKALTYFHELIKRFPESKYTEQSKRKIKFLRNHLASVEINIARYYLKRKNYAAAISRLNTILAAYEDTNYAPEAMHRLVESYIAMGFYDEATQINKLLQQKFKRSKWAQYSLNLLASKKVKS